MLALQILDCYIESIVNASYNMITVFNIDTIIKFVKKESISV